MRSRLHSRISAGGLVAIALLAGACDRRLGPPPLEVDARDSLIGAGKILQIKSTTNKVLQEVEVTITAAASEMVYTEDRLGGYETLEIGWKKLGGWQIPADAEIEIRAAGYLLPYRARLPAAETGSGAAAEAE